MDIGIYEYMSVRTSIRDSSLRRRTVNLDMISTQKMKNIRFKVSMNARLTGDVPVGRSLLDRDVQASQMQDAPEPTIGISQTSS